jgi:hypothetical protein
MTEAEIDAWRKSRETAWLDTWLSFIKYANKKYGADYLAGLAVSISGGDMAAAMLADPVTGMETKNLRNLKKQDERAYEIAMEFKRLFDMDNKIADLMEEEEESL